MIGISELQKVYDMYNPVPAPVPRPQVAKELINSTDEGKITGRYVVNMGK